MLNSHVDYTKLKTVIYCPSGYYGSYLLWNDTSYAFKNRNKPEFWKGNEHTDNSDKWEWLALDNKELAEKLKIDIDILPEYDYEFCTLE
jgi:hypothetical protein